MKTLTLIEGEIPMFIGPPTKVIELEPMLDLLERSTAGTGIAIFDGREIIELLRAHGRLEET